jgi:hypothetical protein
MEVCTQNAAPGTTAVVESKTTATAASSTDKGLTTREKYRVTHGTLMLFAWTLLIPLALGEAVLKSEGKGDQDVFILVQRTHKKSTVNISFMFFLSHTRRKEHLHVC